jgi:phage I-like protein
MDARFFNANKDELLERELRRIDPGNRFHLEAVCREQEKQTLVALWLDDEPLIVDYQQLMKFLDRLDDNCSLADLYEISDVLMLHDPEIEQKEEPPIESNPVNETKSSKSTDNQIKEKRMTYIQINPEQQEKIAKKLSDERAKAQAALDARLADKEQKLRKRAEKLAAEQAERDARKQEQSSVVDDLKNQLAAASSEVVRLREALKALRPKRQRLTKPEKQAALQDAQDKVVACLDDKKQMAKSAIVKRTKLSTVAVSQALKSKRFKKVGKGRNTNWALK